MELLRSLRQLHVCKCGNRHSRSVVREGVCNMVSRFSDQLVVRGRSSSTCWSSCVARHIAVISRQVCEVVFAFNIWAVALSPHVLSSMVFFTIPFAPHEQERVRRGRLVEFRWASSTASITRPTISATLRIVSDSLVILMVHSLETISGRNGWEFHAFWVVLVYFLAFSTKFLMVVVSGFL